MKIWRNERVKMQHRDVTTGSYASGRRCTKGLGPGPHECRRNKMAQIYLVAECKEGPNADACQWQPQWPGW